ncbi:STAS domain-containing protein [Christiangramia flava]|uniref:STAS domain-containing protein n=1 Tax=Christiangramia flava TaxID=1486245 RepID=UPI0009FA0A28|nr:STAS domain-containing protein [Christiangramia flava]
MIEIFTQGHQVKLNGQINSENVSEVEKQIDDLLDTYEGVSLDLNDISSIDTCGFFMLYVVQQRALLHGKKVEIEWATNDMIKKHAAGSQLSFLFGSLKLV